MKKKNPKSKGFWKVTLSIFTVLVIAPFSAYPLSYQPQNQAKLAYDHATQKNGYYHFLNNLSNTGIIFYPGGLVNPISYASFAESLALETQSSVFVSQPLWHLAITNINAASTIIKANPTIEFWFIGGHSLGGSSAAFYAFDHLQQIKGLFFLASYTTDNANFADTLLPILSITGSKDQILDSQTYQAANIYHSAFTTRHIIEGGNHSQFGDYGFQRGDGEATISLEQQQDETIMTITTWLSTLVP